MQIMKSVKRSILLAAFSALLLSCGQVEVVKVAYDPEIRDYSPVISQLLAEHQKGGIKLEFEDGVYPFYPEDAACEYVTVTNNDNGDKRIAFILRDMRDVVIDGKGAEFLFHGSMVPFLAERVSGLELKNFSISYDFPFTFEGEVLSNDITDRSFTLRPNPLCKYEVREDRLYLQGYDWELPLGENIVFDPATGSPIYSAEKYEANLSEGIEAEMLEDGNVRLTGFKSALLPPPGSVYVDKGPHGRNRRYPAFVVKECGKVNFTDVTIHNSGAMSLIAENSSDISLDRFCTATKPGSEMMIASSADATHFVGCTGKIQMTDCVFESMLDDATNVHGIYMPVDTLLDSHSFQASFGHFQQDGFPFGKSGDVVALVDRDRMVQIAQCKIVDISCPCEKTYTFTVDIDLTPFSHQRLAIRNLSNSVADVHIKDCIVRKNRARCFLLSTNGKILVEGCELAPMMAGLKISGDANYWFESGPVDELIVRNNVFRGVGNGGGAHSVLHLDPVIYPSQRSTENFYHGKVVFEGNTIYSYEDQVINILSAREFIMRDNKFVRQTEHYTRCPGLPVIDLQYCGQVDVRDNDFSEWPMENTFVSVHECVPGLLKIETPFPVKDEPNPTFYGS